jgi:hypothetical protein
MDWPPVREQVDRLEEALEIINRPFDGERAERRLGRRVALRSSWPE